MKYHDSNKHQHPHHHGGSNALHTYFADLLGKSYDTLPSVVDGGGGGGMLLEGTLRTLPESPDVAPVISNGDDNSKLLIRRRARHSLVKASQRLSAKEPSSSFSSSSTFPVTTAAAATAVVVTPRDLFLAQVRSQSSRRINLIEDNATTDVRTNTVDQLPSSNPISPTNSHSQGDDDSNKRSALGDSYCDRDDGDDDDYDDDNNSYEVVPLNDMVIPPLIQGDSSSNEAVYDVQGNEDDNHDENEGTNRGHRSKRVQRTISNASSKVTTAGTADAVCEEQGEFFNPHPHPHSFSTIHTGNSSKRLFLPGQLNSLETSTNTIHQDPYPHFTTAAGSLIPPPTRQTPTILEETTPLSSPSALKGRSIYRITDNVTSTTTTTTTTTTITTKANSLPFQIELKTSIQAGKEFEEKSLLPKSQNNKSPQPSKKKSSTTDILMDQHIMSVAIKEIKPSLRRKGSSTDETIRRGNEEKSSSSTTISPQKGSLENKKVADYDKANSAFWDVQVKTTSSRDPSTDLLHMHRNGSSEIPKEEISKETTTATATSTSTSTSTLSSSMKVSPKYQVKRASSSSSSSSSVRSFAPSVAKYSEVPTKCSSTTSPPSKSS